MSRIGLDLLTRQVTGYFRKHAAHYGLNPRALEARYILNWGGFVNASFLLSDGQVSYHLKLADDEETQESLARWKSFSAILAEKYRAPRVLEWVRIPRTPFSGLLCERVPGEPASLAAQPQVLEGVVRLLASLHADQDLAAALASLDGPPTTCSDYFLSVYIDRFDEDLLAVAGELPPFVPLSLLDWMQGETRELEGLARDLPAFRQPAAAPTHGDLWESNILVAPDLSFHIIDWDDLALGDPALEYSILLGSLWRQSLLAKNALGTAPLEASALASSALVSGILASGIHASPAIEQLLSADPAVRSEWPAFRERFDLCRRALILDQVIDPLADWVESAFAPAYQSDLRPAKERTHKEALALYRQLYK